jgi:ribosomal-protein-alanine N-acetyltransferase
MMASSCVFTPMNDEEARAVVSWRYETPYDFYDMANDPEGPEELLGPPERREGYYAVRSDGELVGFFSFGPGGQLPSFDYADDGSLDIGLGLRPDLTGKGLGLESLLGGLEFGRRHFTPAGFRRVTVFTHHTNGADYPFLLMKREE